MGKVTSINYSGGANATALPKSKTYTYDAAFKGRLRSRNDNTLLEYNDALLGNRP
ncbi:MAG: hypothetical protein ACI32C_06220 [Candidatus Enteromonas sp.]